MPSFFPQHIPELITVFIAGARKVIIEVIRREVLFIHHRSQKSFFYEIFSFDTKTTDT